MKAQHGVLLARQSAFEEATQARMIALESKLHAMEANRSIRELCSIIQLQRIDQLEAHICRIRGVASQAQLTKMCAEATEYKRAMLAGVFDVEANNKREIEMALAAAAAAVPVVALASALSIDVHIADMDDSQHVPQFESYSPTNPSCDYE